MSRFYLSTPGAPHKEPIQHIRGDDFIFECTARNKDNTPYDWTGHTFRMHIKRFGSSEVIAVDIPNESFTLQQNQEGIDANVMNQFLIEHAKEAFADLLAIEYVYDIEATDAAGKVFTPIYGPFKIKEDVTG